MVKILLILLPEDIALQAEQYLLKKGYKAQLAETIEETQSAIQSSIFDIFIIDPFSDYTSSAFALGLLRDYSLILKTILIGKDISRLKTIQQKLQCGGFLPSSANYSIWEETIAQTQTLNKSPYENSAYLYKPKFQFLKSEIEKAKRGHTSISFLFFQMKQNPSLDFETTEILIQKILVNASYRLRISDEAMILNNGVLISLFGTHKKDRLFITDLVKKRIKRNLKHLQLNLAEHLSTSEATYPDDGNSLEEILENLQSAKNQTQPSERRKSNPLYSDLSDWLDQRISSEDIYRATAKSETNPTINAITKALPLPPIWFFNLVNLLDSPENSPRAFEMEFLKQCPFHEKVINCAKGLIGNTNHLKPDASNLESLDCKQILLLIGPEEFKNILTWSCLQNIVFKNSEHELTPIREFSTMTGCVALELSNQLEYHHNSELLLLSALQNMNLVILKIGFPDLFESFFNSKNTPFSVLAKNCHEQTGTPYSSLALKYLSKWGISESLMESLANSRYEATPKMNPQLVAITYLASSLVNYLSGLSLQGALQLNQLVWDEMQLRNRNLKTNQFDGFSQFEDILKRHSYLFLN